ncbi:gamma-aminobutyric acid type B receptor subunit 2-like [Saccoglossus kowalevskii]
MTNTTNISHIICENDETKGKAVLYFFLGDITKHYNCVICEEIDRVVKRFLIDAMDYRKDYFASGFDKSITGKSDTATWIRFTYTDNTTIPLYIGGFFITTGQHLIWAGGAYPGVILAIEHINNDPSILPGYHIELIEVNTNGDAGVAMRYLIDMIQSPPQKIMLFGAMKSESSIALAETAKWWNLLQIACSNNWPELSDRSRFPFYFRTAMPQTLFAPARIAILRQFGWKQVAIMHRDDNSFNQASKVLAEALVANNITLMGLELFPTEDDPGNAIRNLKKSDARIIFTYNFDMVSHFCEAYKNKMYSPRYVWITATMQTLKTRYGSYWWENVDAVDCTPEEIKTAAQGMIMFAEAPIRHDGIMPSSGITVDQFRAEYSNLSASLGMPYSVFAAPAYDSIWAMALTLNESMHNLPDNKTLQNFTYDASDMSAVFLDAFYNLKFEGLSGPVMFTETGDRIGSLDVYQLVGESHVIIGTYYYDTDEFIMDTNFFWEGGDIPRDHGLTETQHVKISNIIYYSACVLISCGSILALSFLAFNVVHRQKRFIKMSSPNLNNMIVVGALLVYISTILFGLESGVHALAVCQPDPSGRDVTIVPVILECISEHDLVWVILLFGYKGMVLLFGVFLAWETRQVKYPQLNDSRYIGFAVYNVTVMCCIGVPATMFLSPLQKDLQFILTSLCITFSTTVTLCIVFVPKILEYRDTLRFIDAAPPAVMTFTQGTVHNDSVFPHTSGSCRLAEEELVRYRQMYQGNVDTTTRVTTMAESFCSEERNPQL